VPTLALAICTVDRPTSLSRSLASAALQRRPPDEIIVVDASSAGGPAAIPDRPGVRVLTGEPWLTRQRNVALDACTSELVVFVDDDTELDPGYLEEIEAAFLEPDVIAATGRVRNPPAPGSPLRAWLADLFLLPSTGEGAFRRSTFPTIPCDGPPRDVECLYGCNMAFRRAAAVRCRFDEALTGLGYC
jgi:glycosyltransferase involved in cell wall biosynthesis